MNSTIFTIYLIILAYFILGGIGFYLINRKKDPAVARQSYVKFGTYFVIIHLLFFSIVIEPVVFRGLAVLIAAAGIYELIRLFRHDGNRRKLFFLFSLIIYGLLTAGFLHFTGLQRELILFSFLILSIFDSFSQITGQLWGKIKLVPAISPNKTLGGLIGGFAVAMVSALLLSDLYTQPAGKLILLSAGLVVFAFCGDLAASFYKRKFKVKDFSSLIPGHGGILDRFDSLIGGGAWIAFAVEVLNM